MDNTKIRKKSTIKWGTKLYFVYLHPIGGYLRILTTMGDRPIFIIKHNTDYINFAFAHTQVHSDKNAFTFCIKRKCVLYKTLRRFNQNTSTFKNKRTCVFSKRKNLAKKTKKQGQFYGKAGPENTF